MKKVIIYAMTCCLMSACQDTEKGQPAAPATEQTSPQLAKNNGESRHTAQHAAQEAPKTALEMTETEGLVEQTLSFDKDYLMGKFDPNTHPDFIHIAPQYASAADMRMRKDAYKQFIKMYEAAKKDGISLKIISATRPFHRQKSIWEAKWQGKRAVDGEMLAADMPSKIKALRILRWSSMPGTSRHHWGTDIDLNDLNNSYFETGKGAKIYAWLVQNAGAFGYCQVYSPKGDRRPNGYEEEKWHWSYLPVSRILTKNYAEMLQNSDISGFIGSESAELIDVKTKYVLGINPDCE